jgi:hypothetical protein
MRYVLKMHGVHPLPRVESVQLVAIDRGLGTVDFQYVDPDGEAHELTMTVDEARRLYDALAPLASE